MKRLRVVVLCLAVLSSASLAFSDVVVPSDDVTLRVIVRESATAQSAQIGSLRPGEQAELIGSVPNWHEVRLQNGLLGFVSKRWTKVIAAGVQPASPTPTATAPTFTIDVVDVGTGLAVLVRGSDFTLVYDAGSNDDLARGPANRMLAYMKLVAPTLSIIDFLVLSHPHRDHVELMPDLFANYQVREVWDSGRVNDICGYRAFLTAVRDEQGTHYHNALFDLGTHDYAFAAKTCYGQSLPAETLHLTHASRISETPITLGQGATMTILHADGGPHPSPNENSIVARLDLGGTRVLLVGDSEAGGRQAPSVAPSPSSIEGLLVTCCASELASKILVAAHHGSKTSSRKAFLDAVSASFFVVSSGPMKYGTVVLPDQDIISELSGRGQVFRTDTDDAACATNGTKVGPDADARAGGCDNVRIVLAGATTPNVSTFRTSEP